MLENASQNGKTIKANLSVQKQLKIPYAKKIKLKILANVLVSGVKIVRLIIIWKILLVQLMTQ